MNHRKIVIYIARKAQIAWNCGRKEAYACYATDCEDALEIISCLTHEEVKRVLRKLYDI